MSWNYVPIQRSIASRENVICWVEPGPQDFIRCFDTEGNSVLATSAALSETNAYSVTNIQVSRENVCWQDARGKAWCHTFGGSSLQYGTGQQVQGIGSLRGTVSWLDAYSGSISTTFPLKGIFSQSLLAGIGEDRICALMIDDPHQIMCLPSLTANISSAALGVTPWSLQVSTFSALYSAIDGQFGGWGQSCSNGSLVCNNPPDYGILDLPSGTFTQLAFSDAIVCGVNSSPLTCWGSATYAFDMQPIVTFLGAFDVLDVAPYNGSTSAGLCVQLSTSILCSSTGGLPLLHFPATLRAPLSSVSCGVDYIASRSTCFFCPLGHELVPQGSVLNCEPCPQGWVRGVEDPVCFECPFLSQPDASQTTCLPCPNGSSWSSNPASCIQCPAGSQSYDGTSCVGCPPGTYKTAEQFGCTSCSAFSAPNLSQTLCLSCTAPFIFSYSTVISPPFFSDGFCARCPSGEEPAFWASSGCSPCSGASIRSNTMAFCAYCPPGYTSAASHSICQSCPSGTARGSTDFDCFLCPTGYLPNTVQTLCLPTNAPPLISQWKFILFCCGALIISAALLFRSEMPLPLLLGLMTVGCSLFLIGALAKPNQGSETVSLKL